MVNKRLFVTVAMLVAASAVPAWGQAVYTFENDVEGWVSANADSPLNVYQDDGALVVEMMEPEGTFNPWVEKPGVGVDSTVYNQFAMKINVQGATHANGFLGLAFVYSGGNALDFHPIGWMPNGDNIWRTDLTTGENLNGNLGTFRIDIPWAAATGEDYTDVQDLVLTIDWIAFTDDPNFTMPPEITLAGGSTMTLTIGDTWSEPGYVAIDDVDGDITGDVVVGGDTVDTDVAGVYVITYSVTDSSGQETTVTRTVTVQARMPVAGGLALLAGLAALGTLGTLGARKARTQ